ncbi:MAG: dNTP triphosphohydrolase [Ignavibacteriales bacterium]|nr:dNTP triphosphohydrolase [Ignavibacteriales bacterium]
MNYKTHWRNEFYNEFDLERRDEPRHDYRTPFEQDRDRVVHTLSFRRLQAKTQVFLSGEYDFYRTRLTHSIEVAQIGRSIGNRLNRVSDELDERDFAIDSNLVEAVCLTHDVGHPPFGHSGERTLHRLMRDYGGFEGNAQSLRLIADVIFTRDFERVGMNPTRAYMDGVMKYKSLYSDYRENEDAPVDRHFLYDDQLDHLRFVFDREDKPPLAAGDELNGFRSVECEIMDWADDVAYSATDVADGVRAGFISEKRLNRWFKEQSAEFQHANARRFEGLIEEARSDNLDGMVGKKIGEYIGAASLELRENFMSEKTKRYRHAVVVDPEAREDAEFRKKAAVDLIFKSPQLQQIEFKGDMILARLFEAIVENYETGRELRMLPELYERLYHAAGRRAERARVVCDYLANMTDEYAMKIYNRMFLPGHGSIVDLIV